jgi:MFS family permease
LGNRESGSAVHFTTKFASMAAEGRPDSERQPLLDVAAKAEEAITPLDSGHVNDGFAELAALHRARQSSLVLYDYGTDTIRQLNFSILLPFVQRQVFACGVPVEDVGFYVGAIESTFSLAGVVSFTAAARLGDRFGRRQTLAFLLSVSGLFTIFFGFATTVFQMLLFRTIGGFFSGGIVIIRTLFAEFSDSTNRATAFSYFSFASNIAMMAGTAVGGLLVEPDGRLTSIQLFRDFPFALPCIFAGVATIAGGVSCFIWLREPPHQEHHDLRRTIREIVNPAVLRVLLIQAFVNIFGFTYTALFPLWLFTPVKLGGLAFHPQQIGLIMVVNTLSQAIWGLVLMPRLDRRLGTRKLIAYCFYVWPVFFSIHLLESRLAQGGHRFAMWVLLLATSSLGSGVSMAFSASFD